MKFSMLAAMAALIAVSGLAHADGQGKNAGAYFPEEHEAPPPPLPPPVRLVPAYIQKCVITDITPFSATIIYLGTNPAEVEEQPIPNTPRGLYVQGAADRLVDQGLCRSVKIDFSGRFRAEFFGPAGAPPAIAGPARVVPPGIW